MATSTRDTGDVEKKGGEPAHEGVLVALPVSQLEAPEFKPNDDHVGFKGWLDMVGVVTLTIPRLNNS